MTPTAVTALRRPQPDRPTVGLWPVALVFAALCLMALGAPAQDSERVLRGTIVTSAPSGYAIVEDPASRQQTHVKVDEAIGPGVRLIGVYPDHAIVEDASGNRRLDFGMRVGRRPQPARTYRVARDALPGWIQHVDLIPHQREGRIVGYFANAIPESLRERIGLQPGDVLRSVNGLPLNGDLDPEHLYREISKPEIRVEVSRRGEPVQLVYRLE